MCSFLCFKKKSAYEMRISDSSSDVCSSDLCATLPVPVPSGEIERFAGPAADAVLTQQEQNMSADRDSPVRSPHSGLSTDEAQRRLRQFGANALPDARATPNWRREIGRASCRERVCTYVSVLVVGVELKKKKKTKLALTTM